MLAVDALASSQAFEVAPEIGGREGIPQAMGTAVRSTAGQVRTMRRGCDGETGWHDHHLVQRVVGGSDALKNRGLLHPVCHAQLLAQGLTVAKPA